MTILGALEVDCAAVWVVGDDREGQTIIDLVTHLGMDGGAIVTIPGRSTTLKERFLDAPRAAIRSR